MSTQKRNQSIPHFNISSVFELWIYGRWFSNLQEKSPDDSSCIEQYFPDENECGAVVFLLFSRRTRSQTPHRASSTTQKSCATTTSSGELCPPKSVIKAFHYFNFSSVFELWTYERWFNNLLENSPDDSSCSELYSPDENKCGSVIFLLFSRRTRTRTLIGRVAQPKNHAPRQPRPVSCVHPKA